MCIRDSFENLVGERALFQREMARERSLCAGGIEDERAEKERGRSTIRGEARCDQRL